MNEPVPMAFENTLWNLRVSLLGLASWALPFMLSILFFDREGELTIARPLFKSIMVLGGGGIGLALLVLAFRQVEATLWSGVVIGCYWLVLNLVLDLVILVPMAEMTVNGWFVDIGLRYFLFPLMAATMGLVADYRANKQ